MEKTLMENIEAFIVNNKKSHLGFPSKIQDAKILSLLLDNSDIYPYAEERRLFYVALTRAKTNIELHYLAGTKDNPRLISRFLEEIRNK